MGMQQFDNLRLAMFSGKGGVGKTTLSCGFARRWAQQFADEQVLLVSTDPAHSLGDVLLMDVEDIPHTPDDLPNLQVRALNAQKLLQEFKAKYGSILELLVERGSFVQGNDLSPVWDLSWPGLDELMGILEIQRLLREKVADRVVVDMAPSGHTINLFKLMDFLDGFLNALDLFQEKHRVISETFTGHYAADQADQFLADMKAELAEGRNLLRDAQRTACLVVAIAEPMSWLESKRLLEALNTLQIPSGGIFVNQVLTASQGEDTSDASTTNRYVEQQELLDKFLVISEPRPVFRVPLQTQEPVGATALDRLLQQVEPVQLEQLNQSIHKTTVSFPDKILPGFDDFIANGRRLVLVGGKGGVGKTTVAAAIAWGMAERHPGKAVRVISIDPAHSLGDAFGYGLGHTAQSLTDNLSGQEIDASQVLDQFREEYLWELAEMMSGDTDPNASMTIAYGPEAWRQIVSQALPGIDEMLSLITVMELLEQQEQDFIILDTAPTGHLLRFLEMPAAMSEWLAWIFKLWIKYQHVVGRTEFMGRLRTLRQRVVQAQKKLKDPAHTEFIGVLQAKSAIVAEATRLTQSLQQMGVNQRYVVHNRFDAAHELPANIFPAQTIVKLPALPRAIAPLEQIKGAANLLF
ncbi:MAG TPA: TRC40/GET3/ArsA family transport-energizing ATPase [Crinalium sp.]|jgi:arsenite-transporting ATPase